MATLTFPFLASSLVFSSNTFNTIAWSPSDTMVGSGSQTETAGNHGNMIQLVPSDTPFDLSTLGSTAGNITAATVHFQWAGTYSTAGPGANYDITWFDDVRTQANGASWSHTEDYDATLFFTDGLTYFTDMADLPTWPLWSAAFLAGGNIENGVTVGLTIAALSIEFTYTPSAPVVTDVSPTHGDAAGGTVVTLTGTGFTGATTATFNGSSTLFTPSSDTSGTCVSPAHAVGLVTVVVS